MSSNVLDVPEGRAALEAERTHASQTRVHDNGTRRVAPLTRMLGALDEVERGPAATPAAAEIRGNDAQDLKLAGLLIKAYLLLKIGQSDKCFEALRQGLLLGDPAPRSIIAGTPSPRGLAGNGTQQRIRIYTLGRFDVLVDDQPLQMSAKAPRKPLELLRTLIAMGGRSVDLKALLLQVWPREGAGARSSFDVALMRLRKLLQQPDALILEQGKLSLNPARCWIDAWCFETAIATLDASATCGGEGSPLDLYAGAFLHEHHTPCIVNMRDRLASKFQRAVLALGKQHEFCERWDCAAQVYRRGLEQDNLAEEFYRRLMHCEWKLGHHIEVVRTYRRCRHVLSVNLQSKPSPDTEALYRHVIAD